MQHGNFPIKAETLTRELCPNTLKRKENPVNIAALICLHVNCSKIFKIAERFESIIFLVMSRALREPLGNDCYLLKFLIEFDSII